MTVLELIKASLRIIKVLGESENPSAQQATDAREALNLMLEQLDNEKLLAYTQQQYFTVSSGTYSYTIGPAQTWNGSKPLEIRKAFLRDSDGYDHPLTIITEKEYMELYDKDIQVRPTKLFYLPSNATGTVYLYGKPDAAYTIYLMGPLAFTQYTSGSTTISLPSGYLPMLKYNLAVELWPEYREGDPTQIIMSKANKTMALIKKTNLPKPREILVGTPLSGTRRYDADSDTWQ